MLRITRLDGGLLVIDGAALARTFLTEDPSSVGPGSYDSLAGRRPFDAIETSDVEALNRTMRVEADEMDGGH